MKQPDFQRLGVAGAGAMGSGIALVGLLAGYRVTLFDVSQEILDKAAGYIRVQLEKRKRMLDLEHLSLTSRLDDLSGCGIVIEAVPEDLSIKQDLFARLSKTCPPPSILATNTSTLSVTAIASAASSPQYVAGMHFFNPAAVMPLVEIVSAAQSSPETISTLTAAAQRMGKQPVTAKDTPGFIVNRVARPFYGEALRILSEGAASHSEIDRIVRDGGGFKMGPFQLMDLIGIDINFAATRSVFEQTFYEPRFRPSLIQSQMVAQKAFGRKTGHGFYEYDSQGSMITPKHDPPKMEPCRGEGNKITLSAGTFAPGLESLLLSCQWKIEPVSAGLQDTAAVIIAAGRSEGALEVIHKVDLAIPPSIPLIIQCADISLSEASGRASHPERIVGFDGLFLASGKVVTLSSLPVTSLEAVASAAGIFLGVGKEPVFIEDSPAMVLPRILSALVNEAAFAIGEGVADGMIIDLAMTLGTNYPRGPISWGREMGYGKIASILNHLHQEYGEERYRLAPQLLRWSRL